MSAVVAFLCLLIAALALLKQALPAVEDYLEPVSVSLSIGTVALITALALFAVIRTRTAAS
jgi:hypothetical protein